MNKKRRRRPSKVNFRAGFEPFSLNVNPSACHNRFQSTKRRWQLALRDREEGKTSYLGAYTRNQKVERSYPRRCFLIARRDDSNAASRKICIFTRSSFSFEHEPFPQATDVPAEPVSLSLYLLAGSS